MHTWQAQEAKAKFSKVVKVSAKAPQRITLHGEEAAFMVSPKIFHEWEVLREKPKKKTRRKKVYKSFGDFLNHSPLKNLGLSDQEIDRLFARDRTLLARSTDEPLFD